METTTNYKLPQWVKADQIKMDDFNGAFGKIDAALKANADAAGGKADGAATSAALTNLAKNLGTAGHNCRIAVGSYTGQGRGGQDNPVVFNCPFYPVLLLIKQSTSLGAGGGDYPALFMRGSGFTKPSSDNSVEASRTMYVSWADSAVTWYLSSDAKSWNQFDDPDATYLYVIIGYDKTAESAAEQAAA